jgi:hypothetical protein
MIMRSNRKIVGLTVASCVLLSLGFISGCGQKKGSVKGKVTVGGQKVTQGTISFLDANDNSNKGASIQEDGTYSIDNIPSGTKYVSVQSPEPKTSEMPKGPGGETAMGKVKAPEGEQSGMKTAKQIEKMKETWIKIPDDYQDPTKKKLKFEVKPGENTYDIKIP